MDSRLEGNERQNVRWLHTKGATCGTPSLDSGDELMKELHRSVWSVPRSSPQPLRQCAANRSNAGLVTDSDKMHDTCPTARLVETHPLAYAIHRFRGDGSAPLGARGERGVYSIPILS
jgi:hypothetical protein